MDRKAPPAVLTIAGSDSSGGAGIQADLKAFMAFGCYGASVITALTAQNTKGVQGVHPAPPEFLEQQLKSVLDDIEIKAIKTGMLYDAEHTRRIAHTLKAHFTGGRPLPPLVVDPVSVSTSGHTLLHPGAVDVMVRELFPLATLVTPNTPETELLLSRIADVTESDSGPTTIATLEGMLAASEKLRTLGPKAVLIKGGHISATFADVRRVSAARPEVVLVLESFLDDNMEILQVNEADLGASPLVVDVLRESTGAVTLFVSPRIESTSTHGTGCTLAAAIASLLGKGESSMY
ncbi:hypothetical protein GSI_04491 [Ganoderma sinense ZZ0214-1]|uniref:Pyridoxamine kinase/Phosphomethylpyrimidine kinase domain-containing protein n=1 Tax=Ganoderma sinense ZZ0214-1 TaxID=1077348 RepID=A0A2G8SH08_9APHY|nr:hypothetical protein GSI_04491 [Ganoderma sinense ZZ0214-1]